MITSLLRPRVYRAPSNGAESPPRGPTNTLRERPEGPGRGNEELPRTGNPHLGAPGQPGPPEATIHPHRSPGEGGWGNPRPRALLPVREDRGRSGQGTEGSSPRGHTRAGTKHGSPLSPGAGETEAAVPMQPQTPVWNQPATERTGCVTGHRGGPPAPRTAQDHHRLQDLTAGPAAAAPGSAEPPECVGLPEPGPDAGA